MAHDRHYRRSIRLKGYDYSQAGAYSVTIVAQDRACLFGEVVGGEMWLNDAGGMIARAWETLPNRFPSVQLDTFVVMPNHMHGIIVTVGATLVVAPSDANEQNKIVTAGDRATTRVAPTVGNIIGAFKSLTTVEYVHGVKQSGWMAFRMKLWQRNYHEHVIRNEASLHAIREYIVNNPLQWELDEENPRGDPMGRPQGEVMT